jgi:hypothetical protein
MPDSEAKTKWMRENSVNLTVKFMKKSDSDILSFLEDKQKATVIKAALREYIKNHPELKEEDSK